MIAEPTSAAPDAAAESHEGSLSHDELHRLTLYKWRYSLEAFGFAADEISSLLFLKWLHVGQRLAP